MMTAGHLAQSQGTLAGEEARWALVWTALLAGTLSLTFWIALASFVSLLF